MLYIRIQRVIFSLIIYLEGDEGTVKIKEGLRVKKFGGHWPRYKEQRKINYNKKKRTLLHGISYVFH
jgi:hypothetical protein